MLPVAELKIGTCERLSRGLSRRALLKGFAAAGILSAYSKPSFAETAALLQKSIPATGEQIPAVGLGSWITFNVGNDAELLDDCASVMDAFFASGGRLIDSSPMYGSSQKTIGFGLKKLQTPNALFSADKVWIGDASAGERQISDSRALWGVKKFDLLQVHNLLNWQAHLPMLLDMKAAGQIKYVGITTSEGRRHAEMEAIMSSQPIDFIQVSYNVLDREPEERLLPLAAERKIAVIVNRPFRQGSLIEQLGTEPLPGWADEVGVKSWPQLLLKFIISHPSVTCVIPATSSADHVRENLDAARGSYMNSELRKRTIDYVESL